MFGRLSVVIIHIDSYITVFVLYTDARTQTYTQTYTRAYFESQWHTLALQRLIFGISPSFSLHLPPDIFSSSCGFLHFCCPYSHRLVFLSPRFFPLPPLSSVLLGARVTCVDLLSNLPGLSVIPQQWNLFADSCAPSNSVAVSCTHTLPYIPEKPVFLPRKKKKRKKH